MSRPSIRLYSAGGLGGRIFFPPCGVPFVPLLASGSDVWMEETNRADPRKRFIVWGKHGVVSLSDVSPRKAMESIEYFEATGQYEYCNMAANHPASRLSLHELKEICDHVQIYSEFLRQFQFK